MPRPPDRDLELRTERLTLFTPLASDAGRQAAFLAENREHFAPWEETRPASYFSTAYWVRAAAHVHDEFQAGRGLLLCLSEDGDGGAIVGDVRLSEIVRGPFQACYLGYRLDRRREGRGLMTEALRAVVKHAFETLQLHRIMANYQPTNERSARVLQRLGFAVEGYARDYLFVGGAWRDHVLTALVNGARPAAPGELPVRHGIPPLSTLR